MSSFGTFPPKDPDEVLDYTIDWSVRLEDGDNIASSSWIIAPAAAAPSLQQDSDDFTSTTATIWVSQGVVDTSFVLTNRIVTSFGRTRDLSYNLRIKAK